MCMHKTVGTSANMSAHIHSRACFRQDVADLVVTAMVRRVAVDAAPVFVGPGRADASRSAVMRKRARRRSDTVHQPQVQCVVSGGV